MAQKRYIPSHDQQVPLMLLSTIQIINFKQANEELRSHDRCVIQYASKIPFSKRYREKVLATTIFFLHILSDSLRHIAPNQLVMKQTSQCKMFGPQDKQNPAQIQSSKLLQRTPCTTGQPP